MTLDEKLVARVDRVVRRLGSSRSAFTRDALRAALDAQAARELERKHRLGYEAHPVRRGEFDAWHGEQAWPE
jgi:metal-responsive CopG/Arc/MetJ family transcriptional regulator